MPTTSLASQMRSNTSAFGNSVGMNSLNASKYIFGEEQDADAKEEDRFPTPDIKTYLQLTDPDDRFPTLIRQDEHSGLVSKKNKENPPFPNRERIANTLFSFLPTPQHSILQTPKLQALSLGIPILAIGPPTRVCLRTR